MSATKRTGGQLIVDALVAHGVQMAYAVAGESYLEVLDALLDAPSIKVITCRQEGGAAFMAEAYGKLTGKPAALFVTRGPGASNASIGIHTAFQDSTPMIVLIGQVSREQLEREAFQEVDYRRFYSEITKWTAQIDIAARIPELMSHAFHVATSGRPGPVALALPEDMLRDVVANPAVVKAAYRPTVAHPGADDLDEVMTLLAKAERPMVLVGGSGWTDEAGAAIAAFATENDLPVCCSFRRQDVVDNRLPIFCGDLGTGASPTLVAKVKEADLLLVVGARVGEITSQSYGVVGIPEPGRTLIHIHVSAEEIGRVYRPTLGIQSGVVQAAEALKNLEPIGNPRWAEWRKSCRAAFDAGRAAKPTGHKLDLIEAMNFLNQTLPDDHVITIDAGNFSGWPQRFFDFRRPGRQLGPTNGAMGYSVPAAISAKFAQPDSTVVSFVGDGGFLMNGQELATSMQQGLGPIVLIFNNGMYGTIRMHQERRFPGRVSATELHNPDFVALAKAYGADAERVETTDQFKTAFAAAAKRKTLTVLELMIDPEQITTRATIADIRADAAKRAAAGKAFEEAT